MFLTCTAFALWFPGRFFLRKFDDENENEVDAVRHHRSVVRSRCDKHSTNKSSHQPDLNHARFLCNYTRQLIASYVHVERSFQLRETNCRVSERHVYMSQSVTRLGTGSSVESSELYRPHMSRDEVGSNDNEGKVGE